MDERQPLPAVSETALGIAMVRAVETGRADALFQDPYAQAFLDAVPDAFGGALPAGLTGGGDIEAAGELVQELMLGAVIRTRFFDEHLLGACALGARQVVLLAAGLDTRAYRLDWPTGTRLYEPDLPDVLTFKERVLADRGVKPSCERVALPCDLTGNWPTTLTGAGFDPTIPTAWLAEGLLSFLSDAQAARLLVAIGTLSAAGSSLAFEHETVTDPRRLAQARAMPGLDRYANLWQGGLGPDTEAFLTARGWHVHTHHRSTLATTYGRPAKISGLLLTATR